MAIECFHQLDEDVLSVAAGERRKERLDEVEEFKILDNEEVSSSR